MSRPSTPELRARRGNCLDTEETIHSVRPETAIGSGKRLCLFFAAAAPHDCTAPPTNQPTGGRDDEAFGEIVRLIEASREKALQER